MIERIARIEIAGADPRLYDALLGPTHAAGRVEVVAAQRTRVVFAVADPERARERFARRGLSIEDGDVIVNGLRLGLTADAHGTHNPDVALDHFVLHTPDAQRAVADYGGRLGIELRLERHAPQWGMHMLFFRCGDGILEIVQPLGEDAPSGSDVIGGATWRVRDIDQKAAELATAGIDVGDVRDGRKPGTRVCTVRDRRTGIPTLLIQQASLPFSRS